MKLPYSGSMEEWSEQKILMEIPLSWKEVKVHEFRRLLNEMLQQAEQGHTKLIFRLLSDHPQATELRHYLCKKLYEQEYNYTWYPSNPDCLYVDWTHN